MPGAQATVIGTGDRLSLAAAAFANAELINALDFDAILPPGHVSPYVIPGVLAVAEATHAPVKDLLCGIAIAHEVTHRLGKAMDYLRDVKDGRSSPPPVFGYSSTVFGATAAIGKVKGYTPALLANAIGLAGSMAPLNSQWSFSVHMPFSTVKYAPAGLLANTSTTAASLGELGHTGDLQLLDDPEFGWRRMIGSSRWQPEGIAPGLGSEWRFPSEQSYKLYPHCRVLAGPLDVLIGIVESNEIVGPAGARHPERRRNQPCEGCAVPVTYTTPVGAPEASTSTSTSTGSPRAALRRLGGPGCHAAGTCRMGREARSVVDPQTCVRGVQNLHVVGLSIFPIRTSGNTYGPVAVLAWCAADLMLAQDNAHGYSG